MPTTTFHLSHEDRAALEAVAEASGLGPSSWARKVVLSATGRPAQVRRKPDGTAVAIRDVLGQLGRVGNNLNQMSRHAHQGGRVPAAELAGVRHELERLTAAVLALREPRR